MDVELKIQDTKNKLQMNRLVKEHWGFSEKSYKLFRERLLYNRDIAKEYREIIGDAPDLRKRIPIKDAETFAYIFKNSDKGYRYFQDIFPSFAKRNNISYLDFIENKFKKGNNKLRIFKEINKYFNELVDRCYSSEKKGFYALDEDSNFALSEILGFFTNSLEAFSSGRSARSFIQKVKEHFKDRLEEASKDCNIFSYMRYPEITIEEGKLGLPLIERMGGREAKNFFFKTDKELKETLSFLITTSSELIGKFRMPNKDGLELVISLNPVDWFLCSSGDEWTSCLSLKSNYLYGIGLPSLVGDKNRAMVYITNGEKKSFTIYDGTDNINYVFKADKFISRSWLLLARDKKDHKVYLECSREYPAERGIVPILKKELEIPILPKETRVREEGKYVGRYYVENIGFRAGAGLEFSTTIYLDTCTIGIAKKNKARFDVGEYYYYKFNGCCGGIKTIHWRRGRGATLHGNQIGEEDDDFYDRDDISRLEYILSNNQKISSLLL